MAQRPAFFVNCQPLCSVREELIDFEWFPGLSTSQKIKSIISLHKAILKKYHNSKILEISSKSELALGRKLSAFNLSLRSNNLEIEMPVEVAFQSSKVFEFGGPFLDIQNKTSLEAKKDVRLKNSGTLKYFLFHGVKWELEPKTLFYDWLYMKALLSSNLVEETICYDCFTDIEFNHKKSYNCQARSAALFVSLYRQNIVGDVLKTKETYISFVKKQYASNIKENINFRKRKQRNLLDIL